MNFAILSFIIGFILQFEALFLLLPWIVGMIYGEYHVALIYLATAVVCFILGKLLSFRHTGRFKELYVREGFTAVALGWFVMSVFGAIPFVLTREIPFYIDALFETISGFTTTGSSILSDVEALSYASLFWRSFTHWIGGMGVLVFLLSLLPLTGGSEKFIEEGKRGSLTVRFVVFAILLRVAALAEQAFQSIHRLGHLTVEVLKVILGESHPLDHIIDRLDAHLLGAFEAEALVDGFSAVNLRYKNDCKILFAS